MNDVFKAYYHSPIGILEIIGTSSAIHSILFTEREVAEQGLNEGQPDVMKECHVQLHEYFMGIRHEFSFPYVLEGTPFQQSVWKALNRVKFAQTSTYKELAAAIDNGKAIRAVGTANGRNRLSIVIPCHRIIGSNGQLTGYAGGLWRKKWLLQHEQANKLERE
ncbi:methylated-DNA--[protein]-cysteine S-methyltransferase [Peribacillus kribbensis]|uniref:methylated-DNA--[protein]-cysteine S-methyltransferase n=1 Tax=Peribacillus kribbensis TaxID=356658 RepID=UPI0004049A17|nr:methylated-DNA--[protein]-cysteine S-methyltransferase [Peribacillus kribbensis]